MAIKPHIYQLTISLIGVKPRVWRRFQVGSDIKLHTLHAVILDVMGWIGYHLYMYEKDGICYEAPSDDNDISFYKTTRLSTKTKLNEVLKMEGDKCIFTYDFGDDWRHTLKLEKILDVEPGKSYPVCLTGRCHCPPEDCGGVYGYEELLETVSDPEHEEYETMTEWVGESFDPKYFSIDDVNTVLRNKGKTGSDPRLDL
ncbi:MAG: plasmid pRiA4b ORF-3 family protein [Armatimonadota bacterium]